MQKEIDYKKSLGQNFIFDINLLNAIVNDGDVCKTDTVLEIGAGAGTLTSVLCKRAKNVISFEIDRSLAAFLDKIAKENENLQIFYEDFLKADIGSLNLNNAKVVANIPYYITTPIIFKLVENKEKFNSILVLVQKEVAERFVALPNSKNYGITSVELQAICKVTMPRIIKKECFTPAPKVDSALVKLIPHNNFEIENFKNFSAFVSVCFSMRRKTLFNNLKTKFEKEKIVAALKNLNLSETIRPENLSVKNFVELYKILN